MRTTLRHPVFAACLIGVAATASGQALEPEPAAETGPPSEESAASAPMADASSAAGDQAIPTLVLGDIDMNGVVNADDVELLRLVLDDPAGFAADQPADSMREMGLRADLNGDAFVDDTDLRLLEQRVVAALQAEGIEIAATQTDPPAADSETPAASRTDPATDDEDMQETDEVLVEQLRPRPRGEITFRAHRGGNNVVVTQAAGNSGGGGGGTTPTVGGGSGGSGGGGSGAPTAPADTGTTDPNPPTTHTPKQPDVIGNPLATVTDAQLPIQINAASPTFPVFDQIDSEGSPDLTEYGISPMVVRFPRHLWDSGQALRTKPDVIHEQAIIHAVRNLSPDTLVVLDIEHWPLYRVPDDVAIRHMKRLMRIIDIIRYANPDISIGYFGILPRLNYKAVNAAERRGIEHEFYQEYRQRNELLRPLADKVDAIFPVVYVTEERQELHEQYMRRLVEEARRYGKPVYPFVSPSYRHPHGTPNKLIPGDVFRRHLDVLAEVADGVVIWEHPDTIWNADDPWFLETVDFIEAKRKAALGLYD